VRLRTLTAPAVALGLALACGPVEVAPRTAAPLNRCPEHPCSGYVQDPAPACDASSCVVKGIPFATTLVVSIPQTSYFAAGQTIVLTPRLLAELAKRRPPATCGSGPSETRPECTCTAPSCFFLPPIGEARGRVRVSRDLALKLWPPAGLRAVSPRDTDTTLPVQVTYRPLLPDGRDVLVPAHEAGIALAHREAVATPFPGSSPGPNGGPGLGWDVALPLGSQELGLGWYMREIAPVPPFDTAFPPLVAPVLVTTAAGAGAGFDDIAYERVDPQSDREERTFDVSAAPGAADLRGFRLYLRDQQTRRPVSNVAVLPSGGARLTLNTAFNAVTETPPTDLTGWELVLEPPESQGALPTDVTPAIGGSILNTIQYPALPEPARVSGEVRASDGVGVRARIDFSSQVGTLVKANGELSSSLVYRRTVETDRDGRYAVRLPPGRYDAVVTPLDDETLAKLSRTFVVGEGVQAGKGFELPPRPIVEGIAVLTDGRPLAEAEVWLAPASELVLQGTPPSAWPRATRGRTDAEGRFVRVDRSGAAQRGIAADPGLYDVVVRPSEGSGFPWGVSRSRTVTLDGAKLEPVRVPAPSRVALTLRDPAGNPITFAMVRAFAFPPTPEGVARALPAVEIGRAMTDGSGRFEMLLAAGLR
jgi:hypothetical protein